MTTLSKSIELQYLKRFVALLPFLSSYNSDAYLTPFGIRVLYLFKIKYRNQVRKKQIRTTLTKGRIMLL